MDYLWLLPLALSARTIIDCANSCIVRGSIDTLSGLVSLDRRFTDGSLERPDQCLVSSLTSEAQPDLRLPHSRGLVLTHHPPPMAFPEASSSRIPAGVT